MRFWVFAAGVLGFLGIAAHAYLAHGFTALAPGDPHIRAFTAAAEMLTVHGLALLGIAALSDRLPWATRTAGLFFVVGIVVFAGSLATFALGGPVWPVHLAPVGGTLLMIGWAVLAVCGGLSLLRKKA